MASGVGLLAAAGRFLRRIIDGLRPTAEDAAARELASHLALIEDECLRRGMTAIEARRAARLALGGLDRARELHRYARGFVWMDDARRDLRYAARRLTASPGFTVAVVATMAIAIGGVGAVFSLVNAVLLRPLPYRDPARLVAIWEDNRRNGFPRNEVTPGDYANWASHNDVLESIAAVAPHRVTLLGANGPEKIDARRATRGLFDVLGVAPVLGRVFSAQEDRPGGPRVAILSHGLWRDRFGGDPAILETTILLSNEPFQVVGVMPAGFQFLDRRVGLWVPAAFTAQELRYGSNYLTVLGRLKPGVGVERARANLDMLSARLARTSPGAAEGLPAEIVALHDQLTGGASQSLIVLLAAVGVVLLIACANVASLMMARAAARRHEIALRRSLGASRGRIVRQLLVESSMVCGLGLAAGVVLAHWSLAFLVQLVPPSMQLFAEPRLDVQALAFTGAISLIAGLLLGLAPAAHATTADPGAALKSGGRGLAGPETRRGALVVVEVAMTLVLLVVSGLLMQTLYRLRYADVGYRPENVLTLRTALPTDAYPSHPRRTAFYDEVLARVTRVPGVLGAGYTTAVPLAWKGATTGFSIEGRTPETGVTYNVNHRQVSAHYLPTIGIPLLRGRHFSDGDAAGAPPVVIINEKMARQYWPGADPLGKRITLEDQPAHIPWLTIVGVVGDVRQMGLDAPARAELYVPYRQFPAQPWFTPRDLAVRASGDPTPLVSAIVREVHSVDPALPVSDIRLATDILDAEVAARRVGTTILIAFAAFSALLASVGIYGVISFFVVQHVPEIGVRIALGARPREILMLVAGKGMVLTLAGVGIGSVAALAATRLVSSLLYGFTGIDVTVLGYAIVLLVALALTATYVPARRATKIDPIAALRIG